MDESFEFEDISSTTSPQPKRRNKNLSRSNSKGVAGKVNSAVVGFVASLTDPDSVKAEYFIKSQVLLFGDYPYEKIRQRLYYVKKLRKENGQEFLHLCNSCNIIPTQEVLLEIRNQISTVSTASTTSDKQRISSPSPVKPTKLLKVFETPKSKIAQVEKSRKMAMTLYGGKKILCSF
jgi:hypothetical protein